MSRPAAGLLRRADRWRRVRLPAVAAGLVLVEVVLMGQLGSPALLLPALGRVGDAWADPVASVLALMALLAELLAGYLLVTLALRSLSMLPGSMGQLALRLAALVTPVAVRRLLDLLVGGTLLVQTALAPTSGVSSGHRSGAGLRTSAVAATAMTDPAGIGRPAAFLGTRRPPQVTEPVEARPTPRRSAVPLPPWLGGGPSKAGPSRAARTYTVEAGDTLWDIAAAHLDSEERSAAAIHRYWQRIYGANRPAIGADPDLIHPGARLVVPPHDQRRR